MSDDPTLDLDVLYEWADPNEADETLDWPEDKPFLTPDEAAAFDADLDHRAAATFTPEKPTPTAPAATPKQIQAVLRYAGLTSIKDLLDRPPTDWFLQGIIPDAPVTVLHGSGGSYKSFVALDWALCSANGIEEWHGNAIKQGKCLYIVGEGVSGIPQRVKAWAKANNKEAASLKTVIMESPINLYTVDDDLVEALKAVVAQLAIDTIFVDTLHKSMAGGDENSSKDIGQVFSNAKRIAGNARLIFLHHKTKAGTTQRGSSSIRDDADVVLSLDRDSNTPLVSMLAPDKVRDAAEFSPVAVTLVEVDNDDESTSLVVSTVGSAQPKATARLQIINHLRAEPATKNTVLCALGDAGNVRRSWKQLEDEEIIYSEVRPAKSKRGPQMVDVWFVDEEKVPYTEGLDNAD